MTYEAVARYGAGATSRKRRRNIGVNLVPCALALAISSAGGYWKLQNATSPIALTAENSIDFPATSASRKIITAIRSNQKEATRDGGPATPYEPVVFAQTAMLHQKFQQMPQNLRIAHLPALEAPVAALEPRIARMDLAALDAITSVTATPPAIPARAVSSPPPEVASPAPNLPLPAPSLPLPAPRPANLLSLRGAEAPAAEPSKPVPGPASPAGPAAKPADAPNFLAKLFGQTQPPGQVLAYANPDDGGLRRNLSGAVVRPGYDQWTAVYDISAHTVYLPNGTRLEAHSGLGANFDNPRSVAEHMRGATPPNVYELEPRAQLFHGVRALRLNPVGNGMTYGRAGLLAHTYMLGPRGDTNGCVAFRDYNAFRQAYDAGVIKRLAVVDHL